MHLQSSPNQLGGDDQDPLRTVYLQSELVHQSSTLALILRATPPPPDSPSHISNECLAVARDVFDIHEQCMSGVRGCRNDPYMVNKYINW